MLMTNFLYNYYFGTYLAIHVIFKLKISTKLFSWNIQFNLYCDWPFSNYIVYLPILLEDYFSPAWLINKIPFLGLGRFNFCVWPNLIFWSLVKCLMIRNVFIFWLYLLYNRTALNPWKLFLTEPIYCYFADAWQYLKLQFSPFIGIPHKRLCNQLPKDDLMFVIALS